MIELKNLLRDSDNIKVGIIYVCHTAYRSERCEGADNGLIGTVRQSVLSNKIFHLSFVNTQNSPFAREICDMKVEIISMDSNPFTCHIGHTSDRYKGVDRLS